MLDLKHINPGIFFIPINKSTGKPHMIVGQSGPFWRMVGKKGDEYETRSLDGDVQCYFMNDITCVRECYLYPRSTKELNNSLVTVFDNRTGLPSWSMYRPNQPIFGIYKEAEARIEQVTKKGQPSFILSPTDLVFPFTSQQDFLELMSRYL